jgi:hypothetical protein
MHTLAIFVVIFLIFVMFHKTKESMTNTPEAQRQAAVRCVQGGNQWVQLRDNTNKWTSRCIPPNIPSIDCVARGGFWVNSKCRQPSEFRRHEQIVECTNSGDIYSGSACMKVNDFKRTACPVCQAPTATSTPAASP